MGRRPGEALHIAVAQEDIGGELVSIASEGLYSDPRDTLRELAQNGVDAGASQITIRFTGLNVAVVDNGKGMGFEELLLARRFGRSSKSAAVDVGFRGIGIYSGFQICDRLLLVSQQAGSNRRWTMTFDFSAMRETLRKHVGDDRGLESALGPLIQDHTSILFDLLEDEKVPVAGSTVALLENINPEAFTELSDVESLRSYLRRTLPVPIANEFPFKTEIEGRLARSVPGYRVVDVRLVNDDTMQNERIVREFPPDLRQPKFISADWPPEERQCRALLWACMSPRRTLKRSGGIFFKKRGFTIGDGTELREKFSRRPAIYDWYVGEVYVVDDAVVPNAARNGFEKNAAFRNLWLALDEPMATLLKDGDDFSKRSRALEVIKDVEEEIRHLLDSSKDESPYQSAAATLESIQRLKVRLDGQKIPAKDDSYDKLRARKLFLQNLIEQERSRLDGLISNLDPKVTSGSGEALGLGEANDGQLAQADLLKALREAGWRISGDAERAFAAVDLALRSTLDEGMYSAVVENLQHQQR